jgi:hypothetical protein
MLTSVLLATLIAAEPQKPFGIQVVDAATGRGVPLIELKTVHGVSLFTDSNGWAAFREPGLMNETVFFSVSGHGYEYPKDGFGFRGKQVKVTRGGTETLKINRINIAERLYRVTGGGIYRDSVLLGKDAPLKESVLNGQVLGSDSVMNVVYKGKIRWFWGDTNRPGYPLGNYNVPGATSELPGKGGLDPSVGVNLTYFVDDKGFAKKTCAMPGDGPTWVESLVVLKDKDGQERMYGEFIKVKQGMKIYDRGLAIWNDDKEQFDLLKRIDVNAPAIPRGQTFKHRDGDTEYVYFAHPYPMVRVSATAESYGDPSQYESYTCLKSSTEVDRDADGRLRFAWRKNLPPIDPELQAKLVKAGKIKAAESPINLCDRDTGNPITAHRGSVYWNEYRKRWVMIFCEHFGKPSLLGEQWYAEADEPTGPWRYAVKVVTHDKYSFYNPKQDPMFDQEGGKLIYFEGTYTNSFSGNPDQTPRYDYNQIMYRLDLSDPRLALPRPVPGTDFLALDRDMKGAIPVPGQTKFFMLPDGKNAPVATVPLYEFTRGDEKRYAVTEKMEGYQRSERAVGRVWPSYLP